MRYFNPIYIAIFLGFTCLCFFSANVYGQQEPSRGPRSCTTEAEDSPDFVGPPDPNRVRWLSPINASHDPNDIAGPAGYDSLRWVAKRDILSYTIRFENDPKFAEAPAQRVEVRLPLDAQLDPLRFRLGSFGFGQYIFNVPANKSYYSTRIDVSDSLGVFVDFTAGVDYVTKEAFWIFLSIDPATGLNSTVSPLLGFLPVNDSTLADSTTGPGEGFVTFNISPGTQAATGDTIHAMANIVFDFNPPIFTNTWTNIIDAVAPISRPMVVQLTGDTTLKISALSQDDPAGVGVATYDIYVSEDGDPYYLLADNLHKDSSFFFPGSASINYCFQTLATDWVNNREAVKPRADSCFTPVGLGQLAWLLPQPGNSYCHGDTVDLLWSASGVMDVDLFYSADSGKSYLPIEDKLRAEDSLYRWALPDSLLAGAYQFHLKSSAGRPVATSDGYIILLPRPAQPVISPAGPLAFCEGDSAQLSAPVGLASYAWSTTAGTRQIWVKQGGMYAVRVTDQNGCRSLPSDSVLVMELPHPPQPQVQRIGKDSLFCSIAGDRYQWFLDGLSIPDSTQQISIGQDGVYSVVVYFGDCASEPAVGVPTPLENLLSETHLEIYPNPTPGPFIIQASLERGSLVTLTLFSLDGRPVFEQELFAPEGELDELLMPKGLADGLYLLRIRVNDRFAYRKLEIFR